jgi:hypothetical protein
MNTTSATFIIEELGAIEPGWSVEIGRPNGKQWVSGEDLKDARTDPFHDVLQRLGGTLGTQDRRTIAGSFAMRFGWSAGTAIAASVIHGWVPDIRLENISLRFGGRNTMFERWLFIVRRGRSSKALRQRMRQRMRCCTCFEPPSSSRRPRLSRPCGCGPTFRLARPGA